MPDPRWDAVYDGTNADRLMPLEEALANPAAFVEGMQETRGVARRVPSEAARLRDALLATAGTSPVLRVDLITLPKDVFDQVVGFLARQPPQTVDFRGESSAP